jgi:hypothetical protein
MKKFTLSLLAICIAAVGMTQSRYSRTPVQSVPAQAIKNQQPAAQPVNPVANSKSVQEFTIGDSQYDMQTNGSVGPRHKVYPDGTKVGVWTRGFESAGRGTGYNYFNGTAWPPPPSARIENDRTGWPSYAQLGATGEIVIAHLNDGLKISTRSMKGQGTWAQNVLMGPAGATDISWPAMMTSGVNNDYIHMIASTYTAYQGLDLALLYYRSHDGGLTWDKKDVILPQMTSADYDGFNGDEYQWGTPHGDTIYFAVSGPWVDTFIMKSNDNGETWTKIPVLSNAYKKLPAGTTDVAHFTMSDGSVTCEMDHSGVIHMAFGIGGGSMEGSTKYISVNANGLVYWNTTMPMIQDSLDLDTLEAHGQLLGYVSDGPLPTDTITAAPSYRVGLSSFPQISIDAFDNIYFIWAAVAPGNPSTDNFNYRHLIGRAWFHDKPTWGEMIDFNSNELYLFQEFAYPCMAKNIKGDNLSVIYQTSSQPGSNIVDPSIIPLHNVNIDQRDIPGSSFWSTSVGNNGERKRNSVSQNYPNPATDDTHVRITLAEASPVTINVSDITGASVMEINKGMVTAGNHDYTLDVNRLAPGIYFYSVTIGSEKITKKMIVQ